MAKFNFMISAINQESCTILVNNFFDVNITNLFGKYSILKMAVKYFPIDWQFDDGNDSEGTTYCQLVYYPNKDSHDEYMLVTWNEINEKTGCIK